MLFWRKRVKNAAPIEATLDDIRKAVLRYEDEMPDSVNRLTLVQTDGSLDLSRLTRYLGGVSERKFYVSRETFEIFTEEDRHIPYYLDLVQLAVDDYVNETGKLPLKPNSNDQEVDYRVLVQGRYLTEIPPIKLYITGQEMMLSHRAPLAGNLTAARSIEPIVPEARA
ncbi:DUF3939 domain-containing protein [Paenibacillus sp. CAA11]|uniref:DUF3939 domain-containing protein n=1 Tax=Paenibacillus sp. CAA11 TaxID=1532905 RepID=UPI000D384A8C|nr:DUF3939 domain-containing protein [Paenibacillus sp. CAA11]AWB44407.1 DUF3939 domain-containing protein [Paenibacillus sp. CAA11]